MSKYSRTHLSDGALIQGLKEHVASERGATAIVLADLAEVDARKLYLPAAYPSMFAYCVEELGFSEDAAFKRIRAARTAQKFPAIFAAVEGGHLHLGAVVMLTPFLTPENATELLATAAGKSKLELERLLAQRFPRPDLTAQVIAVSECELAPGPVEVTTSSSLCTPSSSGERAPGRVEPSKVTPLTPERYVLQYTVGRSCYEKLQYALALLGHQMGPKDLPAAMERALDALIPELEKTKFAKTSRPRSARRSANPSPRHIPAEVKRQVWERDHGQCTFVSEKGQRCPARSRLEFDHIEPVARGGKATVEGIRIRCRAHNQYEAERLFGISFMNHKREEAKRAAAAKREARASVSPVAARTVPAPAPEDPQRDVTPWLRQLGFRPDEARRAASLCRSVPDAPLEERVRVALRSLAPRSRRIPAPRTVSRQAPQPHAQL